jgi:hypothetical protein
MRSTSSHGSTPTMLYDLYLDSGLFVYVIICGSRLKQYLRLWERRAQGEERVYNGLIHPFVCKM